MKCWPLHWANLTFGVRPGFFRRGPCWFPIQGQFKAVKVENWYYNANLNLSKWFWRCTLRIFCYKLETKYRNVDILDRTRCIHAIYWCTKFWETPKVEMDDRNDSDPHLSGKFCIDTPALLKTHEKRRSLRQICYKNSLRHSNITCALTYIFTSLLCHEDLF